ncbi:MAG: AAA family ATPase, partial [Bacteroidales bacterium]|nr:AAA family ATPase [Bacteroidales bacterium]
MIERELDKYIDNHYSTSKSALMLTGARQTGKTFAIRKYAETKGLDLVEINFLENADAPLIFKDVRDVSEILLRLSAYAKRQLVSGKTLIFFDEVQKCPEVVTMIKFLVEEGSFRYALSGSLLGVELNDVRSVPVGYMNVKEVFPLDLCEFAKAVGISDEIIRHIADAWENKSPVDEVVHNSMLKLTLLYLMVGGM